MLNRVFTFAASFLPTARPRPTLPEPVISLPDLVHGVNLEAEEKDHRGVPLPPEHEQVVPSAMEQDAEKSAEAKKADFSEKSAEAKKADFSAVKKADEVEKVDEAMKTAKAKKAAAVKTAEAKKAATLKAAEAKKAVAVEKAAKANKKVADVA